MRLRIRIVHSLHLVCVAALLTVGCSKKTSDAPRSSEQIEILSLSVVDKIPASTDAVVIWDGRGEAAAEYLTTPWAKNQGTVKSQLQTALDHTKFGDSEVVVRRLIEWLLESGFVPDGKRNVVRESVLFFDSSSLGAGLYLVADKSIALESELQKLKSILVDDQVRIEDGTYGPARGFSISLPEQAGAAARAKVKAHVAGRGSLLAVASTPELTARLFEEGAPAEKTWTKTAEFKRAMPELPWADRLMNFYFVNVPSLIGNLKPHVAVGEKDSPDVDLEKIPFESIIGAIRMQQTVQGAVALPLKQSAASDAIWKRLAAGSKQGGLVAAPESALVFLSLSGEFLHGLGDTAKQNLPADQSEKVLEVTKQLESVNGLGLGLTNIPGGALFPAVFAIVESSQAKALKQQVKGMLQAQTSSGSLPVQPWKTKTIEGAEVDFTTSGLGIGAFLTEKGDRVILGTNENVVKETLLSKKTDSALIQTLPGNAKDFLLESGSLAFVYVSMKGVGEAMEALQHNLAMFTGGESVIDQQQIANLKNLGRLAMTASVTDKALRVRSVMSQ